MKRQLGISLFMCLAMVHAFAQPKLSLQEAIQVGIRNSYSLQIQQQELQIAQNNKQVGVPERLPSLSFNVFQNNNYNNINSPTSFVRGIYGDNQINFDLSSNYIIYNGRQSQIKQKQLNTLVSQKEYGLKLSKKQLKYEIIRSYYRVVKEREKLKVLGEVKELSKFRLKDLDFQKKLGKASQYEVLRAENSFLIDSTSYMQQNRLLQEEFFKLNTLLGLTKVEYANLVDNLELKPQVYQLENLQSTLIANNAELQELNTDIVLAQFQNNISQAKKLPIVGINSRIGRLYSTTKFENQASITGFTNNLFLGLYLSLPIFNGGEIRRNIFETNINTKIKSLKYNDLKRKLTAELATAIQKYQQTIKVAELNKSLLNTLKETFNLQKDRNESGITNALEFRSIQLEFIQANYNFLETIYETKLLEAEIEYLVADN